jgi:hypothetical protein
VVLGPQADARPLRGGAQVARPRLVEGQALRDGGEEVADILGRLGRRLEEEQAGLGGVLPRVVGGDGALGRIVGDEVELVAGEGDDDVLVGLALELLDPGLGLVEGGLRGLVGALNTARTHGLCDVVDDDGAVRVAVVHGGQRLVALLAGGVPYLELDCCRLVEGDGLGEEGGADCGFPVVVELVLGALGGATQQAGRQRTLTNLRTNELWRGC